MRLFIAVEVPEEIKCKTAEVIKELEKTGAAVKWVGAENLHLTIKFLGEIDERKLAEVKNLTIGAIKQSGGFKAEFEQLGTFPPGSSPRVIWIGISEGGDKLKSLADSIELSFSRAGYPSEKRDFSPHLTIGRLKVMPDGGKQNKGVDKLREKIVSLEKVKLGGALVDRVSIIKSTLTPKGPVYEKIEEVKI